MTIKIMYQQGYSKKRIARELGISINTVRRYLLSNETPRYRERKIKPMKLDAYRSYIEERIKQARPHWIPATVIYEEIKSQGYEGKLSRLRHYLCQLKPAIKEEPVVRFETAPGEQMQVDWAEFSRGVNRLSAFIATLGYSRVSYVELVTDETLATLIQCHEQAFTYFGGVPQQSLDDNMRTVITQRNAYGAGLHKLQAGFWDFSKHCGFLPRVCKPYRAQTKGKVERFIHYLRHSFYQPLLAELKQSGLLMDKEIANHRVRTWLDKVANQRVHGTTKEIPFERLLAEQPLLQPLPQPYCGVVGEPFNSPITSLSSLVHVDELSSMTLQHELSIDDAFSA